MRRINVLLIAVILFFSVSLALPSFQAKADLSAVVVVELLNVRRAPRNTYQILAKLARNTTITLVGRNAGATWVEITGGFGRGWVSAQYIVITGGGEIGSLPVTDTAISPFVTIIAFPAVAVRSGPSTEFPVLGILSLGTAVDVIGQDPKSVWLQVQTVFGTGWILSRYTTVTGNIFAAPNTDDKATPVVINVNYRTNVRSAPNSTASVVYTLGYEEYATIAGVSKDGKWWKISGKFGSGWVSARLVRAIGNLNFVAVAE